MLESISDIKHAFYINLINRTDRKSYIERELEKVGIKIYHKHKCFTRGS